MQYNRARRLMPYHGLWFDVERGCNTTYISDEGGMRLLWFDVERGCNTTLKPIVLKRAPLWFDVERGCNTTL